MDAPLTWRGWIVAGIVFLVSVAAFGLTLLGVVTLARLIESL